MTTLPAPPRNARRHAVLAFLAAVSFAGVLLSAHYDRIEEQEIERMLKKSKKLKKLAKLGDNAREDLCWDLMTEAKIKKKKTTMDTKRATPTQKARWTAMKCEEVLSLFKPKVLGYGDTLRPEVSQSTMSAEHQWAQCDMTKAVMAHMKERGIRFAPGFGTLLAVVRNDVAVVPWDDEIDIVVDNRAADFKKRLTGGLTKASKKAVKGPKYMLKEAWELPGGYILSYKTSGCRWHVHPKGRGYPLLDLWPFKKKPGAPEVDWFSSERLKNAHVHKFEKPDEWYGNLTKTITVKYSVDVPELVEFPLPDDALDLIVDNYGEDALTQCKVSFVHSGCQYSKTECERAKHSRMQRLQFPCVLLPETLHGTTMTNEGSKVPRKEAEAAKGVTVQE